MRRLLMSLTVMAATLSWATADDKPATKPPAGTEAFETLKKEYEAATKAYSDEFKKEYEAAKKAPASLPARRSRPGSWRSPRTTPKARRPLMPCA
jgi:hypothetical protein